MNHDLESKAKEFSLALKAFPRLIKGIAIFSNITSTFLGLFYYIFSFLKEKNKQKYASFSFTTKYTVDDRRWKYITLGNQVQDSDGFIEFKEADCLMFSCLYAVGGAKVKIYRAQDSAGRWYRKPLSYKGWYPKETASTISRDMMMGVLWYLFMEQDTDALLATYRYGYKNHWIMGEGDVARIYFTPALQATLADIILSNPMASIRLSRLERIHCWFLSKKPQNWPTNLKGYQLHLNLLHVALRGLIHKHIDNAMLSVIENAAVSDPENPLAIALYAQYVDGDADFALKMLLNEELWPAQRLPTSADRKEQWLPQRSYRTESGTLNPDWLPSWAIPPHVHSGGDLMFVSKLILKWIDESEKEKGDSL